MSSIETCIKCHKISDNPKQCAKCLSVSYCGRKCQKDDWKTHKNECSLLATARANDDDLNASDLRPQASALKGYALDFKVEKPFTKLKKRTWLHGRSDEDVYKLLIDSWRFRKFEEIDALKVTEVVDTDPEARDGLAPFENYIKEARKKDLLSPGWADHDTAMCLAYALRKDKWSNLHDLWPGEEAFIQHYGTAKILVQFMFFTIAVLGPVEEDLDAQELREVLEKEVKKEGYR